MLTLISISLRNANAFVSEHHRHHKPVTGHKFSVGCVRDGRLVGVAIVGRPVSRYPPLQHRREKCVQLSLWSCGAGGKGAGV